MVSLAQTEAGWVSAFLWAAVAAAAIRGFKYHTQGLGMAGFVPRVCQDEELYLGSQKWPR